MTWPPFYLYQTIHTGTSFFFFRTFSSLSFVPSSLPSTSPFSLTYAALPLRTPTTRKRKQISAVQFWPQSLSHLINSIYLILVFFKKKLKSRELWILSLSPYDRLQFDFFFILTSPVSWIWALIDVLGPNQSLITAVEVFSLITLKSPLPSSDGNWWSNLTLRELTDTVKSISKFHFKKKITIKYYVFPLLFSSIFVWEEKISVVCTETVIDLIVQWRFWLEQWKLKP